MQARNLRVILDSSFSQTSPVRSANVSYWVYPHHCDFLVKCKSYQVTPNIGKLNTFNRLLFVHLWIKFYKTLHDLPHLSICSSSCSLSQELLPSFWSSNSLHSFSVHYLWTLIPSLPEIIITWLLILFMKFSLINIFPPEKGFLYPRYLKYLALAIQSDFIINKYLLNVDLNSLLFSFKN